MDDEKFFVKRHGMWFKMASKDSKELGLTTKISEARVFDRRIADAYARNVKGVTIHLVEEAADELQAEIDEHQAKADRLRKLKESWG